MFSGLLGTALASCRTGTGLEVALASCGSDFCGSDFLAATAVGAGLGAAAGFDFGALASGLSLLGAAACSSLFDPNRLLKKPPIPPEVGAAEATCTDEEDDDEEERVAGVAAGFDSVEARLIVPAKGLLKGVLP